MFAIVYKYSLIANKERPHSAEKVIERMDYSVLLFYPFFFYYAQVFFVVAVPA